MSTLRRWRPTVGPSRAPSPFGPTASSSSTCSLKSAQPRRVPYGFRGSKPFERTSACRHQRHNVNLQHRLVSLPLSSSITMHPNSQLVSHVFPENALFSARMMTRSFQHYLIHSCWCLQAGCGSVRRVPRGDLDRAGQACNTRCVTANLPACLTYTNTVRSRLFDITWHRGQRCLCWVHDDKMEVEEVLAIGHWPHWPDSFCWPNTG